MDPVQTIQSTLWVELLKLAIFAVFVTSIIEVVKGISAVSIFKTVKGIILALWRNDSLCKESILVINFAIALFCCWAFDYGVIDKVIQPGAGIQVGISGWIDYIGTASLIYTGADAMFKKFSSMKKAWDEEKGAVTDAAKGT
jgi:hypothetical protein